MSEKGGVDIGSIAMIGALLVAGYVGLKYLLPALKGLGAAVTVVPATVEVIEKLSPPTVVVGMAEVPAWYYTFNWESLWNWGTKPKPYEPNPTQYPLAPVTPVDVAFAQVQQKGPVAMYGPTPVIAAKTQDQKARIVAVATSVQNGVLTPTQRFVEVLQKKGMEIPMIRNSYQKPGGM